MAQGAEVALHDLLLLTLRGDVSQGDEGCSDIGWSDGTRVLIGHNEDGDPSLDGLCFLLTLRLEDEPAVTTWWYPGFLPGNTFTVNGDGMVWGVDAIRVSNPLSLPGRGFLARALQGTTTLEEAIGSLAAHPTAGGFSYLMTRVGQSRILVLEHAGGLIARDEISPPERPCIWHTNHLVALPSEMNEPSADSMRRFFDLASASPPPAPDVTWILDVLARGPDSGGVRAMGAPGDALTLCTVVVDTGKGEATLLPNGGPMVTIPIEDLALGDASRIQLGPGAG
jgi:hypothetical protein